MNKYPHFTKKVKHVSLNVYPLGYSKLLHQYSAVIWPKYCRYGIKHHIINQTLLYQYMYWRINFTDCLSGLYGTNCSRHCSQLCKEKRCDISLGTCFSGCEIGYTGNFCNISMTVFSLDLSIFYKDKQNKIILVTCSFSCMYLF